MRTDLFQFGDFTLHSGAHSHWKIECDSLTGGDITALAEMIRQMVEPFSSVEGVPRGGLRLAEALKVYAIQPHEDYEPTPYPILVVDDVWTTGNSMRRQRGDRDLIGAVVFARGQLEPWTKALFQMPECFWVKK